MSGSDAPQLSVIGIRGFLEGEERALAVGESLVIGRSRRADLSVRKSRKLLAREDATEIMHSHAFQSVSRQHVRIHYLHPGLVEVKDLSRNGTFVDGRRADCVALTDLRERSHVIQLGASERLRVELMSDTSDGPQETIE
jgi:hypothetical protein